MFAVVRIVVAVAGKVLSPERRFTALALVVLAVAGGIVVYGFLTLKTGLLEKILGEKATRILNKLHLN